MTDSWTSHLGGVGGLIREIMRLGDGVEAQPGDLSIEIIQRKLWAITLHWPKPVDSISLQITMLMFLMENEKGEV